MSSPGTNPPLSYRHSPHVCPNILSDLDRIVTLVIEDNAWHFLASGWGDPGALTKPGWSWIAVPLLSGIVSATVQLFFSWRIWKLSANWMLACAIAVVRPFRFHPV